MKTKMHIFGFIVVWSPVYHGRYECFFYGRKGKSIKNWIRETFGDNDDLVYANYGTDGINVMQGCEALITDQQLTLTLLRWS